MDNKLISIILFLFISCSNNQPPLVLFQNKNAEICVLDTQFSIEDIFITSDADSIDNRPGYLSIDLKPDRIGKHTLNLFDLDDEYNIDGNKNLITECPTKCSIYITLMNNSTKKHIEYLLNTINLDSHVQFVPLRPTPFP